MRWLLTADWQTRFSNLDRCRQAHKQELEIIKEYKIEGHMDLGDLKDEYSPVAIPVVEFQFERTKNLLDAVDPKNSIKLLGNHDRIGQYADDRNWFSLFSYLGGHVVSVPEIVSIGKTMVFCLPFSRNKKKFRKAAKALASKARKVRDRRRLLIFHHEIKGARFSRLRGPTCDSEITPDSLYPERYKRVFGGHIHLRQKFCDNGMYVGNPFACDWGEIDQEKGFIVYDDERDKLEFIRSEVPGLYSYTYLQKHSIREVAEGTKIKETVECNPSDNYHLQLDAATKQIVRDYPAAQVTVVPKFNIGEQKYVELSEESSDLDKLRLYVRTTLSKDLKKRRKKVFSYLSWVLTETSGQSIRSVDKIYFDKVTAVNTLSFKEVEFDFRKRGLVLIVGINKDGGVLESNGAGKTSLLSLPAVALEGKTFKGQKSDKWANWRTKKTATVYQELSTSKGDKVHIIRQRRPVKLQLLVNDKDESEGCKHEDTQKKIREIVGYTFDTLANSIYVDNAMENAFMRGTDAKRAELIHRFQNLDRFKVAREYAAKDLDTLRGDEDQTTSEYEALKQYVSEREQELSDQVKASSVRIRDLAAQWAESKKKVESAQKRVASNIRKLQKDKETLDKKFTHVARLEMETAQDIYRITMQIDEEKQTLKEMKKNSTMKECALCHRPITKSRRRKMYDKLVHSLEKKTRKFRAWLAEQEEYKEKMSTLQAKATVIRDRISEHEEFVAEKQKYADSLKSKLEAIRDMQSDENKRIVTLHERIDKAKRKRDTCQSLLIDIRKKQQIVKYAVDTFGRDGLPAFLCRLVVPLLNQAAEHYSNLFLDGEIQVLFELLNNDITPRVVNAHGGQDIESQSDGEKAWAGIIASFALREGVAKPSNMLILDEPGNGLDPSGAKRLGERLSSLTRQFDTILVTTHNISLQNALSQCKKVTLIKENAISRIVER